MPSRISCGALCGIAAHRQPVALGHSRVDANLGVRKPVRNALITCLNLLMFVVIGLDVIVAFSFQTSMSITTTSGFWPLIFGM